MSWNKFRPFTDYIEIKPFTGHPGNKGEWHAALASSDPKLFSQAEGCFPVSGEVFDYKRKEVKINNRYYPTGNIDNDFNELEKMVSDVIDRNKI